MRDARAIGRVGGLAVALGIGAALAATPGIAAAAPDLDISFDGMDLGGALTAAPVVVPDIDISFDGMDVFHTDHHTALAFSGPNDFAIAIGAGSHASAGAGDFPGQFDSAVAEGTNAFAESGLGNSDSAFVNGADSFAEAGGVGTNLSNGDFASAIGDHNQAQALPFSLTTPSGFDSAEVFNPFGSDVSQAAAGGGFFDVASVFGDNSNAAAGFGGDFDLGEVFGNALTTNFAQGSSFLTDILTSFGDFRF
jgi:hypothetical protein